MSDNNGTGTNYNADLFEPDEKYHIRTLITRKNLLQKKKTYRATHNQKCNKNEDEELSALIWVLTLVDEISYD